MLIFSPLPLNTTAAPPAPKPCVRDRHERLRDHLPEPILRLTSLKQLRRRCPELAATYPRLREELPLVLVGEERRRQLNGGRRVSVNHQRVT